VNLRLCRRILDHLFLFLLKLFSLRYSALKLVAGLFKPRLRVIEFDCVENFLEKALLPYAKNPFDHDLLLSVELLSSGRYTPIVPRLELHLS
jgi:hypothetical protein